MIATTAPPQSAGLEDELLVLAGSRIFFGHQSVGMNLLAGIREISAAQANPLRISEVGADLPPGVLGHAFLAENGNPGLKLRSFERALDAGIGAVADVAFIKLCYADFAADTDPTAVFSKYRTTLNGLRRRYPTVVFAHITVPLTTVRRRASAGATVKAILGQVPRKVLENSRREEFNDLLRRAYADSSLVFDLAVLESTTPDGSRELHRGDGRLIPALCAGYTDDGGHLNAAASAQIGRALVAFLATVVPRG